MNQRKSVIISLIRFSSLISCVTNNQY